MKSRILFSLLYLLYHHNNHCFSWIHTSIPSSSSSSSSLGRSFTNSLSNNNNNNILSISRRNKIQSQWELKQSIKPEQEEQQQTLNNSDNNNIDEWKVIYQKVISSIPISIVISYIRDVYPLPSNLSLPYERCTVSTNKYSQSMNNDEGGSIILSFVCSMDDNIYSSSIIPKSSLVVQILGICVDTNDDGDTDSNDGGIPSMAMISIKKLKNDDNNMLLGLEEASEKELIKSLERGLDDLVISRGYATTTETTTTNNIDSDIVEDYMNENKKEEKDDDLQQPIKDDDKEIKSIVDLIPKEKRKKDVKKVNDDKNKEIKSIVDMIPKEKREKQSEVVVDVIPNPNRSSSSTNNNKKKNDKGAIKNNKEIKSIIDVLPTNKKELKNNQKDAEEATMQPSLDSIVPKSIEELNYTTTDDDNKDDKDNIDTSFMEQGIELSPEELLNDMLSFDTKDEDQELNFATNAIHKAKELLKQKNDNDKIKSNMQKEVFVQEEDNLKNKMRIQQDDEEELKRMFQQGQQLAQSRMDAKNNDSNDWLSSFTDNDDDKKYVDDWIQTDKSVNTNNAVQLEDELAEFEMRVASRNPVTNENNLNINSKNDFDIFSNPNIFKSVNDLPIDPATIENWPGGNKQESTINTLPKELKDAYSNAQFASKLLISLREEVLIEKNEEIVKYYVNDKEISIKQVQSIISCVEESIKIGLIQDPFIRIEESNSLDVLLDELERLHNVNAPKQKNEEYDFSSFDEERFQEVISEYKDILLSDNFMSLVKEKLEQRHINNNKQKHDILRFNLSKLIKYAMFLLQETQVYGSEIESSQLEIIRSICEVAMNPMHKTEEETALALQEKVRTMKPLLDDIFVSYLKYAIEEEEGRLARRGMLDSLDEHFNENQWLMVLKIVQAGVYAELQKGINRHLEHIWYILRMETRQERKQLLSKLIDDMPTLDIRPFVKVVDNIASSLGSTVYGQFKDDNYELSKLTPKILQLSKDVHELLPPEKIALRSRDADEWLKRKKEGFLQGRKEAKEKLKQAVEDKKELSASSGSNNIITEEEGGLFMP